MAKKKTIMELFDAFETPKPFTEEPHILKPQPAPLPPKDTKEETNNADDSIINISIDLLDTFHDHPFKPYDEERLAELAQSVGEHGILEPIIVRPRSAGRYEILAGHNRAAAAKLAGFTQVPCVIKNADDDEAIMIMTESNFKQRERLLPSEKAFAYKLQMEALKKQGKNIEKYELNPDDNNKKQELCQLGKNGESQRSMYRFIRLTYLLPELLQLVDSENIAVASGEDISYLDQDEQTTVHEYFFLDKRGNLDMKTAKLIRQRASEVDLTYMELEKLLQKNKKSKPAKFSANDFKRYIPVGTSKKETLSIINVALGKYYEEAGS